MEQLVARRAHNPKVVGSSPASATQKPFEGNFRGFLRFGLAFGNQTLEFKCLITVTNKVQSSNNDSVVNNGHEDIMILVISVNISCQY